MPAAHHLARWIVVVPVKRLDRAKSRMRLPDNARAALVLAMLEDTLAAASAAEKVQALLVVTSDSAAIDVAVRHGLATTSDPGHGLNAAIRHGWQAAATLSDTQQPTGLAALPGDLPALQPVELGRALAAAESYPCAIVADRVGTGTTLLTTDPAHRAEPHFGRESRAAHLGAGAHELAGNWPGLRCDVDVLDDLDIAVRLGVGARTAAVVDSLLRGRDLSRAN